MNNMLFDNLLGIACQACSEWGRPQIPASQRRSCAYVGTSEVFQFNVNVLFSTLCYLNQSNFDDTGWQTGGAETEEERGR